MKRPNWPALSAMANAVLIVALLGTAYAGLQTASQLDRTCRTVWGQLGGTLNAMSIALHDNDSERFASYDRGILSIADNCERSHADDEFDGNLDRLFNIGLQTDPPAHGVPVIWWDDGGRAVLSAGFLEIGVIMFNAASPAPVYTRAEQLVSDMKALGYRIFP